MFTVVQLKDALREANLAASGTKAELISRLESHDPEIWKVLAARYADKEPADLDGDNASRVEGKSSGDTSSWELCTEMEMIRRERDLLQREVEIMRREQALLANTANAPNAPTNGNETLPVSRNIQALANLLCEFEGDDENYQKWEQQIELIRATYCLNDNLTRILICSKAKGRALKWFHSKSEHLSMSYETLKIEMRSVFDHRPTKLRLKKEFEKRVWQREEPFSDYYHDKTIMANRVPIPKEEIIDYMIDGIPDVQIRRQAIMRGFQNEVEMLTAFKNISLRPDFVDQKPKDNKFTKNVNTKDNKPPRQPNDIKCYNCNGHGHLSSQCTKPKRERNSCFECGSTSHQIKECPKKRTTTSAHCVQQTGPEVHPTSLNIPYMVKVRYNDTDDDGAPREQVVNALVDSGSPISLIKGSLVPKELKLARPSSDYMFSGINGSQVDVLGIFQRDCMIENIDVSIKFYVVPDHTITCDALIGRDLISRPTVKVTFTGDKVIFENNDKSSDFICNEIMNIECAHEPTSVKDRLNIDCKAKPEISKEIEDMYRSNYLLNLASGKADKEWEMSIKLKSDQPISFSPRRLAFTEKEKLRVILDELLADGIIRRSDSPYASPIVLVRKKNGEVRLCVDYRELNKITVKDNFPTPLIDDHLDRLKGKKYFTNLDLRNGFYHVKMAESSVKLTSFVTPLGQYEYVRMPFGLTNAPREFQRYIYNIFDPLIRDNKVLLYLDDILIATETIEEHLEILREVFELAGKCKLKIREDKCYFLHTEITYLGYLIDENGIRPSNANIESIVNYPIPRNAKAVHRFVCLASYFRRFVPNFSVLAKPLYDLIKKEGEFVFSPQELEIFEILKKYLSTQPTLAIYAPDLETELHCDASSTGFGAILLQKQKNGVFQPISYFSKRTTPAESKYHSFELECLAAVYAIKRFQIYLYGIKFRIVTDCDSFRLTLAKKGINPRISRWAMFLQDYNYEIVHRPGKRMSHVDALSRCHNILVLEPCTFEQTLAIVQDRDAEIIKIREKLEEDEDRFFELRDGLVYRKCKNDRLLFLVPKSMYNNVIRTCHDDLGHVGLDKVLDRILQVYWFPDMRNEVKKYIANCLKCVEFSPHSGRAEGFLHSIPKDDRPFQTLHVDHCGPFTKTKKGFRHILSVVDAFTKFVKLYPCKSTTSGETISHLREYFRDYSKPKRIVSDRGTCFTSKDFSNFVNGENVSHVLIVTGTPRANGQVERFNRVISPMLAKECEKGDNWCDQLPKVEFSINNTRCRSTGYTPSMLLFGIDQIGEVNDRIKLMLESELAKERNLPEVRMDAVRNINKVQAENEINYNKKRKKPTVYKEGDYVMLKNVDATPNVNKKLIPSFRGPYVIKKALGRDRYVVNDIDGFQVTQRSYTGTVAADQIKRYVS